jgi:hypothetical protein
MNGIRFYLDFETPRRKRRGEHEGNVTAVFVGREHRCPDGSQEAIGAVYYWPNSAVASTAVSRSWLTVCAKRISEARAREIHPALFDRLDANV